MKLVLVRHGESLWNQENRFTGWTDVGLSEKGAREAEEAGRLLAEQGFDFDVCYTSYLKRAIRTLNLILERLDREWLPVEKDWRLNERHYGALQGLNKTETAEKFGEAQVKIWRRSYDVRPPALRADDERNPSRAAPYRGVNPELLPLAESLRDTVARTIPFYESVVRKEMEEGRRVLIVAHGNSLRALVKHLSGLSDGEITDVNIPTGVPLVYEFDGTLKVLTSRYLADAAELEKKMRAVAEQGKAAR